MRNDTIAAVSTPAGTGGIAVIRVSGPEALAIVDSAWKGRALSEAATHTAHLGRYVATDGSVLDECVATVFRAPATFTGEDVVEIGVHGSPWIQREVLADLIRRGARAASGGEFTRRAFMNGRLDLAQAEGVADLIAASSRAAHAMAISQTRGNFSRHLDRLREQLIDFASLLELELDFSEEDVEFADRKKLLGLSDEILREIDHLIASYSSGAVLKEGVPVAIAGVPNAGKSSLLNLLLNDDKAIVTDIPGTTRDTIEDTVEIDGILYRFIDTAGLRDSADVVESIGIERARAAMEKAAVVIWVIDSTAPFEPQLAELRKFRAGAPDSKVIVLLNKSDVRLPHTTLPSSPIDLPSSSAHASSSDCASSEKCASNSFAGNMQAAQKSNDQSLEALRFSTKTGEGLTDLTKQLGKLATNGYDPNTELMVTNARHYEALLKGRESLKRAVEGIEAGISGDFIAQDVRETLHHLGAITGAITDTTLLHSIFSRFCIGK